MPEPEIPPGHVLIRLADLAALIAAQRGQPSPGPAPAGPPRQTGDAWSGLGAAVAMCTAHLGENRDLGHRQLAQGIPPELIIGPLVAMAAAALRGCLEDGAEAFLRDMGLLAAAQGRGPDGKPL